MNALKFIHSNGDYRRSYRDPTGFSKLGLKSTLSHNTPSMLSFVSSLSNDVLSEIVKN